MHRRILVDGVACTMKVIEFSETLSTPDRSRHQPPVLAEGENRPQSPTALADGALVVSEAD
jgi:hypothetical protein